MIVDNTRFIWRYAAHFTICDAIRKGEAVAQGMAKCSERDVFDKTKGREISLARCIQELHPMPPDADLVERATIKVMRQTIWEIYRTTPVKPRW